MNIDQCVHVKKEVNEECTPNPYDEIQEVKIEDIDIEEQFIDEHGIHNRQVFLDQNQCVLSETKNNSEEEIIDLEYYSQEERILKCSSCEYNSNLEDEMKEHIKKCQLRVAHCDTRIEVEHLKNKKFKCSLCEYYAEYKHVVKNHIESVHLKKKHQCHLCEQVSMKDHVDIADLNKKYQCHQLCEYTSVTKRNMKEHIEYVHFDIKYQCSKCDYVTKRKYSLSQHIKSVHLKIKEHKCHLCEHTKTYTISPKIPIKTHFEFQCHLCNFGALKRYHLKSHIYSVHFI